MSATEAPTRRRGLLLVLSGNMLMDAWEVSTLVVTLPVISADLGSSPSNTSWLMVVFAVAFGGSVIAGGVLTSRFGRRPVYLSALALFALASLGAGLAPGLSVLLVTRAVKGVCVALTAPTGLAIIATSYPEGPSRNRALSLYSLCGASGFSIGLVLAGAFAEVSWRWSLALSTPVALLLFAAGLAVIPTDPGRAAGRPSARSLPWTAALVRSALGAGCLNGSYWGLLFLATYMLHRTGHSALFTGIALLPASVPLAVSALHAARVVARIGTGRMIAVGASMNVIGCLWYALADPHASYAAGVLPAALFVGLAFVASFTALHVQALTGVAAARQQVAGAVYQTSVQLVGAAVLAVVASAASRSTGTAQATVVVVAALGWVVAASGLLHRSPGPFPKENLDATDRRDGGNRQYADRPVGPGGEPMAAGTDRAAR